MKRDIKPDWYVRRSRAISDIKGAAGWYSRHDMPVDDKALRNELLAVFDRYVPREEPRGEGE